MFETVGQSSKTDKKQQAGSFLLSLAINGGFVGGLILAGATVAEEVIEEQVHRDNLTICEELGRGASAVGVGYWGERERERVHKQLRLISRLWLIVRGCWWRIPAGGEARAGSAERNQLCHQVLQHLR